MSNGNIPYDKKHITTNVGKRLRQAKTTVERDVSKFAKGLAKEAGGALKRTAKKAVSVARKAKIPNLDTPETLAGKPGGARGAIRKRLSDPKNKAQTPRKTKAQTKYNKNVVEGGASPTAPLARPQTVSETRGLQDRTTGGGALGPISVEAPSFVKSVDGMKNPLYDPETLRPGMRRTETGYFTNAPPPSLNITPFDTAEERAAKQKGLESWFGGVADFHSEKGVGRQSGLRERALAHVKGKYGLEEKRMGTAGRIREQEIASGAVVEASKEPGIRGGRGRYSTVDEYEGGEKVGEGIFDTYSGERVEGAVGATEMPDHVAEFRARKINIDELGRRTRDLPRTEKLKLLPQFSESQQKAIWNTWNEGS